jgi:hypothetical protein
MAETPNQHLALTRTESRDAETRCFLTGERIGTRAVQAFRVYRADFDGHSEPVFVLKDLPLEKRCELILNHPAKKCMEMLKAAEAAGESVNLEDLPHTNPEGSAIPYAWGGLYIPTEDEVQAAIDKANEPFCDKGVWAGSPEGQMIEAAWPSYVDRATLLLRALIGSGIIEWTE